MSAQSCQDHLFRQIDVSKYISYGIVAYSNNVNVGTATITVTGKGNYKGTITEKFTIQAKPLKDVSVTYANLMSYTGKQVCPEVKVMDGAVVSSTISRIVP